MKNLIILCVALTIFCLPVMAQTPTPTPLDPVAVEKQRADRLQSRLNDYGNRARYHDANTKLAPPASGEDRVVFMGDSITDFWKLNEYFPNMPYVNRGISGQTTSQMLLRFRDDAIDLKPKVVVFLAGTNDISTGNPPITLAAIEGNLASMAELSAAHGIKVVMGSVMPVSDYNLDKAGKPIIRTVQRSPAQILELNKWLKSYCAEHNFVYLDYFTATVDDKGFFKAEIADDGLHPNAKGYAIMKPLAAEAIKAAMKSKQKM